MLILGILRGAQASAPTPDPTQRLHRPRNWFRIRGRMDRGAFWSLYLGSLFAMLLSALASDMIALSVPLAAPVAPLVAFAGLLATIAAITGAMVRRLRDAGLHWWLVPVAFGAFLAAFLSLGVDMMHPDILDPRGDPPASIEAYITRRTAAFSLFFLAASGLLLLGLVRRSKPAPSAAP